MTQIKKMWMTTTIFKHSGCLHWCARWKHLAVCRQLCCSPTRYIITMECKICSVSSKWQKCDAFYQAWIWLDTAEEVHCRCVRTHTSAVNEDAGAVGRRKRNTDITLNKWWFLPKPMLFTKFPYTYTNSWHDKENIQTSESLLLWPKCTILSYSIIRYRTLWEKLICTKVLM